MPLEVAQVVGLAPQIGSQSLAHVLGWHLAILALSVIQWVFFRVVHAHKSNQERYRFEQSHYGLEAMKGRARYYSVVQVNLRATN